MNAQQLKNSILQDAIMGKLVPQDPNDEPASVLLDKIRKEKARLVKEGKLKKKDLIETPISKDEIPFEIPEGWEWCRFFHIFNLETNLVKPELYQDYPHVAPDNIEKGTGKLLEYRTVKEDKVKSYNHLFHKGQIVYSKIRPLLRKAIIVSFEGLCSADMYPLSTPINLDYALYYLLSDVFNKQVSDICSSRVKMPKINKEELSTVLVPLPPLAEQHRIVAKIEELLPKVEEYGKAQEALDKLNAEFPERLKKSILQEAIMGKLVPQDPNDEPASVLLDKIRKEKARLVKEGKLKKKDLIETPISEDEIPFEIPEGWEWCPLGNVVSLLSGRDLNPQDYNDNKDGIPYITGASNFDGNSLIINRWTPKPVTISKYGDLLITCKGTIGTMAFNAIGNIHIARQVMAISPYVIDIKYIKYFLVRKVYELEKKAKSIIPGISREDILSALFPLPPLAEQHRIVAKIEELLTKIDKLNTK